MALYTAALEACDHIESAVEAFSGGRDESTPPPTAQLLKQSCEKLKLEAAKVGFMCSQPQFPTQAEGEGLIKGFQSATVALCAVLLHTGGGAAGATLKKSGSQLAEAIRNSSLELLKTAFQEGSARNSPESVARAAGMVIDRIELAAKAPLDNKTAIGRAITLVSKQLADVVQELSATEVEAAAENTHANGDDEDKIQHDDDDFDDFGTFTAQDVAVIRAMIDFLQSVQGVLRSTLRVLVDTDSAIVDQEQGEAWESVLFHTQQLRSTADDLAAACYPQQDGDEICGAAEAVVNGCELIIDEAKIQGSEEVRRVMDDALKKVLAVVHVRQE